jgi:Lon protease-like protein
MFPLGMPLLPGGILPLHVFEDRYRQMLSDCLAVDERGGTEGRAEFGQVLITRGREAGGGDERAMIGTAAQIVRVEALDTGTFAVVAVGTRRIAVDRWLDDDPYPRAEVSDFPDLVATDLDHAVFAARAEELYRSLKRVLGLAVEVGEVGADALQAVDLEIDATADPVSTSYRLAGAAPLGPADRYRLLAAAGPEERLGALGEVLTDVESMLQFRLS